MDVPPFINIGGTCPPCPIGIDAPGYGRSAAHSRRSTNTAVPRPWQQHFQCEMACTWVTEIDVLQPHCRAIKIRLETYDVSTEGISRDETSTKESIGSRERNAGDEYMN